MLFQPVFPDGIAFDIGKGKESCPAGAALLQQCNAALGSAFILHDDILDGGAQRDFHGSGIAVFGFDEGGHRPDDPPQRTGARLLHHKFDAVVETFVVLFQVGKQLCALQLFSRQLFAVLLAAFDIRNLIPAAFQLVEVAVFAVLQPLQLVLQLCGKGTVVLQFLAQTAQIFILIPGLSAQHRQTGYRFLRQRTGRFRRKLGLMDLVLQLFLLQRQRALFGGKSMLLLPFLLQLSPAIRQFLSGLPGRGLPLLPFLPQRRQLLLQFPGGKGAAVQLLLQLFDGLPVVPDGILFDGGIHPGLGDGVLPVLDLFAFMLDIERGLLGLLLDLLDLALDLIQTFLRRRFIAGGDQLLILQFL